MTTSPAERDPQALTEQEAEDVMRAVQQWRTGSGPKSIFTAVERILADRLSARPTATTDTAAQARTVTVTVYDREPGPEVTEVEALGSGDRWRRAPDRPDLWDLLVLSGVPERHPWANLVEFDDAPLVPVGTRSRLADPDPGTRTAHHREGT